VIDQAAPPVPTKTVSVGRRQLPAVKLIAHNAVVTLPITSGENGLNSAILQSAMAERLVTTSDFAEREIDASVDYEGPSSESPRTSSSRALRSARCTFGARSGADSSSRSAPTPSAWSRACRGDRRRRQALAPTSTGPPWKSPESASWSAASLLRLRSSYATRGVTSAHAPSSWMNSNTNATNAGHGDDRTRRGPRGVPAFRNRRSFCSGCTGQ
jgi:hypothetical protein